MQVHVSEAVLHVSKNTENKNLMTLKAISQIKLSCLDEDKRAMQLLEKT